VDCDYRELLIKFFAEEISEEELDLLKKWLSASPENKRIFDEENELWRESSTRINLDNFNVDLAWDSISSKYDFVSGERAITVFRKNNIRFITVAATFALIIITGSVALLFKARQTLNHLSASQIFVSTNYGDKAHVILPDSSEIILNSGSKVQYDGNYNIKERKVKLNGEAYFQVKTNPEKPFIVKAGKIQVYAIGTKFNILSYENEKNIEATLVEGKVAVITEGKETINLQPDQQAVISKQTGNLVVNDVDSETITAWKENKLRLKDEPLEEALQKIARKYNVVFEVSNRDLYDLRYTATFIDESLEEVMELLKVVLPITYKIYYRTTADDKQYTKPRVVIGLRKTKTLI
jgi:ferric-dicitrate binding protein FerR (iron transport regulator)